MTDTIRSGLVELRERVRAAKGADVKLDWAIATAIGGEDLCMEVCANYSATLTASIDAALSLTERVLPGWRWHVRQDPSAYRVTLIRTGARIEEATKPGNGARGGSPVSAPLAILDALLSALIDASQDKEEGR